MEVTTLSNKTNPRDIRGIKKGDTITDGVLKGEVTRVNAVVTGNRTYFQFRIRVDHVGLNSLYFTL